MSDEPKIEVKKEKRRWVFLGRLLCGGKVSKLSNYWGELAADGKFDLQRGDACRSFKKFDVFGARIGAVYEVVVTVKAPDSISVFTAGEDAPRYRERYPDEASIVRWTAESDRDKVIERLHGKVKRDFKEDAFDLALRPIAEVMAAGDIAGEQAIMVVVQMRLERLTRRIRTAKFEANAAKFGR